MQLTVSFSSSILERRLILRLRVLIPFANWRCELCLRLHLRRSCEPGINVERNIVENPKRRKKAVSWDHRRQILNTAHAHFNALNIRSIPFSGKSQGIAITDWFRAQKSTSRGVPFSHSLPTKKWTFTATARSLKPNTISTPEIFSFAHDWRREELWRTLKQCVFSLVFLKNNEKRLCLVHSS